MNTQKFLRGVGSVMVVLAFVLFGVTFFDAVITDATNERVVRRQAAVQYIIGSVILLVGGFLIDRAMRIEGRPPRKKKSIPTDRELHVYQGGRGKGRKKRSA